METREEPTAEAAGTVEIVRDPDDTAPVDGGGPGSDDSAIQIPTELPLLPLKEHVLFPAVVAPLTVTREASIKLIDDAAVANNRVIGVVTLRDPNIEQPGMEDIYPVGTAAAIRMMVKMPDGIRLIVRDGLQVFIRRLLVFFEEVIQIPPSIVVIGSERPFGSAEHCQHIVVDEGLGSS